jgi:hypothetical protein
MHGKFKWGSVQMNNLWGSAPQLANFTSLLVLPTAKHNEKGPDSWLSLVTSSKAPFIGLHIHKGPELGGGKRLTRYGSFYKDKDSAEENFSQKT